MQPLHTGALNRSEITVAFVFVVKRLHHEEDGHLHVKVGCVELSVRVFDGCVRFRERVNETPPARVAPESDRVRLGDVEEGFDFVGEGVGDFVGQGVAGAGEDVEARVGEEADEAFDAFAHAEGVVLVAP